MEKRKRAGGLLRRFMPYYKPYLGVLALDLFCAALTTVCELVLPLIVRYITDLGANDIASLTVDTILRLGLLYLLLRLIDGAAKLFYGLHRPYHGRPAGDGYAPRLVFPSAKSLAFLIMIIRKWDKSCPGLHTICLM